MDEGCHGVVPSSPLWHPHQYAWRKENNFQSAEAERMPLGHTIPSTEIGPAHSDELWLEDCNYSGSKICFCTWMSFTEKVVPYPTPPLLQASSLPQLLRTLHFYHWPLARPAI